MIILKIWNALFSQDLNAFRLLDRYWRGCSVSFYRMVVRPYRTTMYPSVGRLVRSCNELSWRNVLSEGNTLNCHRVRIQSLKLCQKLNTGGTCVSILSKSDKLNLVRSHRTVNQVFYNIKNYIPVRQNANPWSKNGHIQIFGLGLFSLQVSGKSVTESSYRRSYQIDNPWRSLLIWLYFLIAI